jgi:isocitrate dehydrogenase (NAD+)
MMQLVSKPQQFDVMVTPNFYGSLVTNGASGLIGGPGLSPGANIGAGCAIFEQGARHAGLDIAGKNVVNPTAIVLSSVSMLRYLKLHVFADRIENAIFDTLSTGIKTSDVGGNASTSAFMDAVVAKIAASHAGAGNSAKKSKGKSLAE